MALTAREAEQFQDGCWSNKRCLRDKRGQEEKIVEIRKRDTQLRCSNKQKVREVQWLSEQLQQSIISLARQNLVN